MSKVDSISRKKRETKPKRERSKGLEKSKASKGASESKNLKGFSGGREARESKSEDRVSLSARERDRKSLDRDPGETPSDRSGSRRLVKEQAETADRMRGVDGPRFNRDSKASARDRTRDGSPANDLPPEKAVSPTRDNPETPGVDNEELGVFEPGAEVEPVPEVEGEPTSTTTDAIGTRSTYNTDDGREVARTERADGTVVTTYEDEAGNPYTETRHQDGRSTVEIGGESTPGEALNSRTVEYNPEGTIVSDEVSRRTYHENGAEERHEVHNVEYGADGKPVKEFESKDTFDKESRKLSESSTDTEYSPDGSKSISRQVRNEDGTGYIEDRRVDGQGKEVSSDRLSIGRAGVDPKEFTEKLAGLVKSNDAERLEEVLEFVGKEDLARVSNSAQFTEGEGFQDFLRTASEAGALSPEIQDRLAQGLLDGIATGPDADIAAITNQTEGLGINLGELVAEGGPTGLAVNFAGKLSEHLQSQHQRAQDGELEVTSPQTQQNYLDLAGIGFESVALNIAEGLEERFADPLSEFRTASAAADEQSGRLLQLQEAYGPFMTEEQRARATEQFYANHEDVYGEANEAATGIIANAGDLLKFQAILDDPAYDSANKESPLGGSIDTVKNKTDEFMGDLPDLVESAGLTENGSRELAGLISKEGRDPGSTFVGDLDGLISDSEQRKRLETTVTNVGLSAAAEAASKGESEQVDHLLDGVGESSPQWGSSIAVLKKAAKGGGNLAELKHVQDTLPNNLKPKFGAAASALGVAGLLSGGASLTEDPQIDSLIGFGADSVDVGADVFKNQLVKRFGEEALDTVGKVTGGIGIVLGLVDTAQSLADGDRTKAGLTLTSTLGGALILSNAAPGVGHALVAAAAVANIGVDQYRDSEASNYFEEGGDGHEDARRFVNIALEDSKLKDPQRSAIINTLKDSDDDPRAVLPGQGIQAIAEEAGVNGNDLFNRIALLGPEKAGRIINAVHSLGGDNTGLLLDLGVSDPNRDVTEADLVAFIRQEFDGVL